MRILYGQEQMWVDVSDKVLKDGWIVVDGTYNALFGDPIIGVPKVVKIEDPSLPKPLIFPENETIRMKLVDAGSSTERYYLIELNPCQSYGLCNQLFTITSALVIGSEVGRTIAVKGFHASYDSPILERF